MSYCTDLLYGQGLTLCFPTMQDDFSPTAKQYLVGGNFMFHGQEILFT